MDQRIQEWHLKINFDSIDQDPGELRQTQSIYANSSPPSKDKGEFNSRSIDAPFLFSSSLPLHSKIDRRKSKFHVSSRWKVVPSSSSSFRGNGRFPPPFARARLPRSSSLGWRRRKGGTSEIAGTGWSGVRETSESRIQQSSLSPLFRSRGRRKGSRSSRARG